tara:strand:- start:2233 stop:3177 length:945 start_codon:yes stop_codon:yes gene_type:complete
MKKKFFFIKIFIIFLFFQEIFLLASVENTIVANIGNQIISSYELKNKIKTILFLSKQELNQKNINLAKQQAIRSLIDSKIKEQELSKYDIKKNDTSNSNIFLQNISSKYETNIDGLKKIFLDNDLDFEAYSNELKTEFYWQKLIFSFYKDKINLNDNQIKEELDKIIKNQKNIKEYQLAEIEIPFLNNSKDQKNIEDIYSEIKKMGFKNAAIKFSESESSFDGGDLGWISEKSLSDRIFKIVKKMKTGNVSKPIQQTNTLLILKLLDTRMIDINKINIEEMRKKIIDSKRNEFLNLFSNNHLSKLKNTTLIKIK